MTIIKRKGSEDPLWVFTQRGGIYGRHSHLRMDSAKDHAKRAGGAIVQAESADQARDLLRAGKGNK